MNEYFDIINETNEDLSQYDIDMYRIYEEVKQVLQIQCELELALTFTAEKMQVQLNKDYRNRDYVADVLTFALETSAEKCAKYQKSEIRHLGDIFICLEQAKRQAIIYDHSLRRELSFLFTHGMLHILGFDHITKEQETEMFSIQRQILEKLKIKRSK